MRNIIVTGGTRGLGLAIAHKLVASGFRVIAVARNRHGDELGAGQAGEWHFRAADLSDIAGIPGFFASITSEFGPCYGLVNNAGIGTAGILATMPESDIEKLLRLNLHAPIILTKIAIRSMMVGGAGGRIINMSSIVASSGSGGISVYAATKSAFVGFTRSLAREVGPLGITVNTVAPGFVTTEMTHGLSAQDRDRVARRSALRRLAEPEDVACAVDYLVGDGARNVTGTTLTVDAGNTA